MSKIIQIKKSRDKILDTLKVFEDLVCATMGPDGQNIALHNDTGRSIITKDGVTVANAIDFEEPEEKLLSDIIKEAAQRTNTVAGDGTTTSICIASSVAKAFSKLLAAGYSSNEITREIQSYRKKLLDQLDSMRVDFTEESDEVRKEILYKIAMISTNGDQEISEIISEAVFQAGQDGLINVRNSYGDASWERANGVKIPQARFAHAEFARGCPDQEITLKKVRVLLTTYELEDPNIINILNENILKPVRKAGESILVIGKSGKSFLENMIQFNATGQFKNCVVQPPYFGDVGREMLDDIAAYVGGKVIDQAQGHQFENVELQHLGYVEKAVVNKSHTTVYEAKTDTDRMEERLDLLRTAFTKLEAGTRDDRKIKERLASLQGNVFVLNVPKVSTIEDGERLDRVEDAINACRGALESGYLPGGGAALYQAWDILTKTEDSAIANKIFSEVCKAPVIKILSNAGIAFESINTEITESGKAFDVRKNKSGKALEIGVIDSHKVITNAVKNGISIGTTLMTCTGIIADKPQENSSPFEMY